MNLRALRGSNHVLKNKANCMIQGSAFRVQRLKENKLVEKTKPICRRANRRKLLYER
jgi:hypothetical protein